MSIERLDGTIISSSQLDFVEWLHDRSMPIMYGVILEVRPCDSPSNSTALNSDDFRGFQHEAKVLASEYVGKQPDLIISNVVIPPGRHSGLDNFEEDLPRGTTGTVDGSPYNDDLKNVDYAKLDGEWCLVGFIGGNIDLPILIGWWPHPANKYDLGTSGTRVFGKNLSKTSLTQFDPKSGKSRFVRRLNGTIMAINKEGSVYLDTSEANSSVKIVNGQYKRSLVDKGGHLQIDLSLKSQFEINWNDKEHANPRIGAGSNSKNPVTDVDLLHPDQQISGSPKPRETTRTYVRGKEYELLLKTSNLSVFCEKVEGEQDGEFIVQAHDGVTIAQQPADGTAATISIRDGTIQLVASDGTQINVLGDEVQIVSKSGSVVSLKESVATVSAATIALAGSVAISGAVSISSGSPSAATEASLKGDTYLSAEEQMLNLMKAYFLAAQTSWGAVTPPQPQAAAAAKAAADAVDAFKAQKSSFSSSVLKTT